MNPIVWREQWGDICRQWPERGIDEATLETLANLYLLPTFKRGDRIATLKDDLDIVAYPVAKKASAGSLVNGPESWDSQWNPFVINPDPTTAIEFPPTPNPSLSPEFFAASKNFLQRCELEHAIDPTHPQGRASYFGVATVASNSQSLVEFAAAQVECARQVRGDQSLIFANSAYYMGSKKALGPFLVESLKGVLDEGDVVLDLMCGAGAASKALSYCWEVIAADGLEFCATLARALGSSYSIQRATQTLDALMPHVQKNAEALSHLVQPLLAEEDDFAHSESTSELEKAYIDFVDRTPRYPEGGARGQWQPNQVVRERQEGLIRAPYCLVTAYFANVYYGIRQSVEIDSIRYAIDQLDSDIDRAFALAALVATCSQLGSGYAGQFAQPITLTPQRVSKVIERRAQSIFHEFSVRFAALAGESEKAPHEITTVKGAWQDVLAKVDKWEQRRPAAVYLDAPYTRDEYSRYYHTLETIVRYNYPSSRGKGRCPDRAKGEFFVSPFFTKNIKRLTEEFVKLIHTVLLKGWVCAWSYSDHGMVDILDVVERVTRLVPVSVVSYSTPYQFKAQGGNKPKQTTEYCVIFCPKGRMRKSKRK